MSIEKLQITAPASRMLVCLVAIGLGLSARRTLIGQTATAAKTSEWRYYAGDAASTKYSALDQINRSNVKGLKVAWRWKAENFGAGPEFNWEATPLMVGRSVFVSAGRRRDVVAIDAVTGETLWMWRYDEGRRSQVAPNRASSGRGLAFWTDGRGDERILVITAGYRLAALNANTGQ